MSWRLVVAVILLSLPGYYSFSRYERGPTDLETNGVNDEFNIDKIAEDPNSSTLPQYIGFDQNEEIIGEPALSSNKNIPLETNDAELKNQENKNSTKATTPSPKNAAPTPQHIKQEEHHKKKDGRVVAMSMTDFYYVAIVAGCSVAGVIGIGLAGVCWYKLQKRAKLASDVDYPAYGITGPNKDRAPTTGDRKLAQSAQMYHYQHQKQQMIAMEKANGEMKHDASDDDSEEENDEGDYTVYECPGLAPTGEMEVKNPLFNEEGSADPGTKGPDPEEK